LLFIQQASAEENDPVLRLGKERVDDVATYRDEFWAGLQSLLEEIFDKDHPFEPTEDRERCTRCPYRQVCYQIGKVNLTQISCLVKGRKTAFNELIWVKCLKCA